MRAIGSRGGKGRKAIDSERVHEGLRSYLKREVSPAEVWDALKLAMTGANESARVQASRVLMDALAEPAGGCPVCREREQEAHAVHERAEQKLTGLVVESVRAILEDNLERAPAFAGMVAAQLDADLRARIAELQR
jgi:hypothetical protein